MTPINYLPLILSCLLFGCSYSATNTVSTLSRSTQALDLPPAIVTEAPNNEINLSTLGTTATIIATYEAESGHTVGMRWTGKSVYNAPVQTVGTARPIQFNIPKTEIAKDVGGSAVVTYSVGVGTNPLEISRPQSISVISGSTPDKLPKPIVTEAPDNEIDLSTLGTTATAIATYEAESGHTVGMRWTGKSVYNAPVQKVGTERPIQFKIPKTEIAKDVDGDAVVTYSVGIDGNPLEISQPLTLHIIAGSTPGEDAAKAINARYRDTRDSCSGDTPAYYCDGVVIRATENGNFDPWDPSPSAVKLGGVSFSYMRVDAHVDSLYHNSGFIFFDQNSAIAQQKAPVYLCIYAYDAGTIVGVRSNSGCGLKPRSVPAADLSSCSSVNVRTVEQWYTYTQTLLNRDYQCSLSTADAVQFATSYQVRAKRPPNMEALWNEIMITTWPQDYGASLPIEAFFYKTSASAGLAEAKAYQTKFKNKTGRWVPIVRLNLAQLNGEPFSYAATDQAAQP